MNPLSAHIKTPQPRLLKAAEGTAPEPEISVQPEPQESLEAARPTPLKDKLICTTMLGGLGLGAAHLATQALAASSIPAVLATGGIAAAAVAVGYAAADLASGIFHHWIDNYPTQDNPVVGEIAYRFQVHHREVHDLENQSVWSNVSLAGAGTALPTLALALANPPAAVLGGAMGLLGGAFVVQASHRWTHEKNPPALAKWAQDKGLVQSRGDHLAHHRQPFAGNYCIVNGMCNPLLEKTHFWRKWEKAIFQITGREPNCWRDPGVKAFALGQIDEAQMLRDVTKNRKIFKQVEEADFLREQAAYLAKHGHN